MTYTNITFVKDSTIVTVGVIGFEEIYNKKLSVNFIRPATQGKPANTNKFVDLKIIEQDFSLDFEIVAGLNPDATHTNIIGQSDSSSDAEGKKSDLITMIKSGGAITMYYNDQSVSVNLNGVLSVKKIFSDTQTVNQGESSYTCKGTFVVGTDM